MPRLITAPTRVTKTTTAAAAADSVKNEQQPVTSNLQNLALKKLVTKRDHAVQHWIDQGRMPGMPNIDPFYAPYCARPKPRRLLPTRSRADSQPKSPESESREKRRIIYDSDDCVWFLKKNGCFVMSTSSEPTEASRAACKTPLKGKWSGHTPTGTAFDENKIQRNVEMLALKPENAIIRAIGELVVPSVASLDEPWDDLIPLDEGVPLLQHQVDLLDEKKHYFPRPQPDYSVGFSSDAFSKEQLLKLEPFLGG
ncbi:hypothetical protein BDW72DRAFT_198197 [Aspergillus terricola var. indicus]